MRCIILSGLLCAPALASTSSQPNTALITVPRKSLSCETGIAGKSTGKKPRKQDMQSWVEELKVNALFGADGRYVHFTHNDDDALWDSNTGKVVKFDDLSRDKRQAYVLALPEGTRSAIVRENLYDGISVTGTRISSINLDTMQHRVLIQQLPLAPHSYVLSADGTKLLFTQNEKPHEHASIVDLVSGAKTTVILEWPRGARKKLFWPQLSNDGKTLASRENSNFKTIVWKLDAKRAHGRMVEGRLVSLAPSGNWIVSDSHREELRLHRSTTSGLKREKLLGLGALQEILAASKEASLGLGRSRTEQIKYSPDGRYLVVAISVDKPSATFAPNIDRVRRITEYEMSDLDQQWVFMRWDLRDLAKEPYIGSCPVSGNAGYSKFDFAIKNDGDILVAGMNAKEVFAWQTNADQVQTTPIIGEDIGFGGTASAHFSPDGNRLVLKQGARLSIMNLSGVDQPALNHDVEIRFGP